MAFTRLEKLRIVEITEVEPASLDGRLTSLASAGVLTSELENTVRDELDSYEAVRGDFTKISPNTANFGAEINPDDQKQKIRRNICLWLGLDNGSMNSAASVRLERC